MPPTSATWRAEYNAALGVVRRVEAAKSGHATPAPAVLRVFQLDGDMLEAELQSSFNAQIGQMLALLPAENLLCRRQDELEALVQLALFRFSFWEHNQFYGDKLQNLHHRCEARAQRLGQTLLPSMTPQVAPSPAKKVLYALLLIVVPYVYKRLEKYSMHQGWATEDPNSWKYRAYHLIRVMERAVRCLQLFNFLVFLRYGVCRSLVDRLLGLRLVHGSQRMMRMVNLEYMNYQIRVPIILNFVAFISPLLRLHKLKAMLKSAGRAVVATASRSRIGGTTEAVNDNFSAQQLARLPCAVCGVSPVVMPQVGNCGHIFCYYCVTSMLGVDDSSDAASASFPCPTCGTAVRQYTQLEARHAPVVSS